MQLKQIDIKATFFIALLLVLFTVLLRVFTPFLDIIVVALVVVQLFYPVYKLLYNVIQSKGLASAFSTILVYLFVLIPITLVITFAVSEVINFAQQIAPTNTEEANQLVETLQKSFTPAIDELNGTLNKLKDLGLVDEDASLDFDQALGDLSTRIQESIVPVVTGVISGALNVLFYLFLLTLALIYLFIDFDRLPKFFMKFSPLDNRIDRVLLTKFTDTTRAVITGTFFVAMAQASVVIIPMVIMGIGAPVLLWVLMVILSLIPVGAGLIFIPIGLLLIIAGRPAEGIFLIVYGAIAINVVDAALRPRIMKGKVQLHPLIIIFSVIGGISAFGVMGILYGPLIAVLFTTLMEIYNNEFNKDVNYAQQTLA